MRYLPAGLYYSLIWFLSSRPLALNISGFDKTAHIVEYFILGFLLAYALNICRADYKNKLLLFLGTTGLLSAADEIHQYFVPGRSCDFLDFTADVLGALSGFLIRIYLSKIITMSKTVDR